MKAKKTFSIILLIITCNLLTNCWATNPIVFSSAYPEEVEQDLSISPQFVLLATLFTTPFDVPFNSSIIVDGNLADWDTTASLYFTDPSGNSSGPIGTDAQRFFISQDGTNLYFYMELNGTLPTTAVVDFIITSTTTISSYTGLNVLGSGSTRSYKSSGGGDICNPGGLTYSIGIGGIEIKLPVSTCLDNTIYTNGKSSKIYASVRDNGSTVNHIPSFGKRTVIWGF